MRGVDPGSKLAFVVRDGEVAVRRARPEHENPAIGAFLALIEADIPARRK
jgi:antitoxin PrlF